MNSKVDQETSLAPQMSKIQQEAITHNVGPLLILAGAGSGKTRVITERITQLIITGQAAPWNILAVTFTNKATEEMRSRVHQSLGARGKRVCIRTFHSLALAMLRQNGESIGLDRNFSIADRTIQKNLIQKIYKKQKLHPDDIAPNFVIYHIDRARDQLLSPDQYLKKIHDIDRNANIIHQVYQDYLSELTNNRSLDYGGLLYECARLLQQKPEVRDYYQNLWKYLMIDEYQDTNYAQYQIGKMIAEKNKNIMVVGDEDQSIYSWRGADIRNILDFGKDYPNAKILKLEENYRSTKNILQVANNVICHNQNRNEKIIFTNNHLGEKVRFCEYNSDIEESQAIVSEIKRELDKDGKPSEMGIFYRINAQSRVLEEQLRRANIPYLLIGDIRFFDRKEIKDILAYLQVVCNPQDSLSLLRIINVPARGIGQVSINRLNDFADAKEISLYQAMEQADQIKSFRPVAILQNLYRLFEKWRSSTNTKISKLVEEILKDTNYIAALPQEHPLETERRASNIYEFINTLRDIENDKRDVIDINIPTEKDESETHKNQNLTSDPHLPQTPTLLEKLDDFLKAITLNTGEKSQDDVASTDCVRLMTMHNAKGLEFEKVWIVGIEEGYVPHSLSVNDEDQIEEERRLLYVGITRAMQELAISYVRQRFIYGRAQMRMPSRFLADISEVSANNSHDTSFEY